MIDKHFKMLCLIGVMLIVLILFGIYRNINGRYQPFGDYVIDTQTGLKYYWKNKDGWRVLDNDGKIKKVESLPY